MLDEILNRLQEEFVENLSEKFRKKCSNHFLKKCWWFKIKMFLKYSSEQILRKVTREIIRGNHRGKAKGNLQVVKEFLKKKILVEIWNYLTSSCRNSRRNSWVSIWRKPQKDCRRQCWVPSNSLGIFQCNCQRVF